jgi:hypothetical protein
VKNNCNIQVFGDFDGGNPKDPKSIIQTGLNAFTIIPYSEDNDPNYKFRLDIRIINNTAETRKIELTIDWQEPKFIYLRNYLYGKNKIDVEWTYYPLEIIDFTKTFGIIEIQPGQTHFSLNPKYNYEDYLRFIDKIVETEFISKEKIGLSFEGRPLWMIKIGRNLSRAPKRIAIISRVHPYETSGSFCLEAMLEKFLRDESETKFHLFHDAVLYLVPMANPDGVYKGLCKLTDTEGIDLSKDVDIDNPVSGILMRQLDKIRPHIYCELHNWMFPDYDGIYFLNWLQAKKFIKNLPSQKRFNKVWKINLKNKFFATPSLGLKKYCRDKYGSISFVLEYSWYSRPITEMKKLGYDTLNALMHL